MSTVDHILGPGQISLDQAQVERGNAERGGMTVDPFGNEVFVLKVPAGFGTFSNARDAVNASRAARVAAAAQPRTPPVRTVRDHPVYRPLDYVIEDLRSQILGRK